MDADGARPRRRLTDRETQVLGMLARAMSNQEIADELYLSVNSVKTHCRKLYRKIGVANRTEAVVWFHAQPTDPSADALVLGRAEGILMVEGKVDAEGAKAVLVDLAIRSGHDVQAIAHAVVARHDIRRTA